MMQERVGPGDGAVLVKRKLQWSSVVAFSIVVALSVIGVPAYGYFKGYVWLDWTMLAILYVASGLGITVGYHRLFTHRSFKCPDWMKIMFLVAGGWAFENSALKWCSDHGRHHQYVDTERDPYNAQRGFWYSHCGWLMEDGSAYYTEEFTSWLRKDWTVMWQYRWYMLVVLSGLLVPFLVGLLYGGLERGVGCLMLAGIGRMFLVLNSTFCINSVCHLWGSQPYDKSNSSRDSWWVSLITFGEGYHNYHHTYPGDYRNGPYWYNFDPSKWIIFWLSKLRLAWNLGKVSQTEIEKARNAILTTA